ncbi:Structural maintenance of chromosomes 4, SMC4 [Monocercomonoides exilis]|uniref:Structural maintenance of chromosomes 4, SMC4 n=1 Tax=Monocercomonoides exilis TaxID=2049356 RepID=UPI003559EC6F|nr:Structural maintenance of chromosomes 4, SMC4 [Monocercomonoides exilis]|eukprot:MONOS_6991.1-p1 / transcript=MONOS_6991.1 / gene=MONOS_6991 / organism=Monocercomonoides_exilis_PA203 / gene_product=Structural maintenance of chromosomes 4, SMC4 / transcript_product=Structural maintenance of chromosomes 4, SMC4 / location=Mono_scaffold00230:30361-35219(+) / protein_length=1414 / sequence_SO=supercontig / SO=protein_coding / is_pseudo=false
MERNAKRLIITSIDLENFKSYYGKHTIGPFHPSFSCVIGPNGSGKSNVIEAILFVFGFRARDMRMKRAEELIHKSEEHMDTTHVTVSIHFGHAFEKADGSVSVEETGQFVVSRTVVCRGKSSSSIYKIDNRECSIKELEERLKQERLDIRQNRYVILQGEVESIGLMKPKGISEKDIGLLEYIEEIIGTNRFIKPIYLSEEKKKELDLVCDRKIAVAKIAEHELNELEGPKEEAELYVEKQVELICLKARKCYCTLRDAQVKGSQQRRDYEESQRLLKERRDELAQLKIEEKDLNAEYVQKKKIFDQKAAEMTEVTNQLQEKQNVDKQLEKKSNELLKKKKVIEKKIQENATIKQKEEKAAAEAEERLKITETESEKFQEQIDQHEQSLAEMREQLSGATAPQRAEIDALTQKRGEPERELRTLQASVKELEKEIQQRTENEKRSTAATQEAKESLTRLGQMKKVNEERLDSIVASTRKKTEDISQNEKKIAELQRLEAQISSQIIELQSNISSFEEKRQGISAMDKAMKALSELQKKGKIKGFYGRLGSLGRIRRFCKNAVLSAGGSKFINFVVETADEATICVNELKKKGIGVETFIVLEQMAKQLKSEMEVSHDEYNRWVDHWKAQQQHPHHQQQKAGGKTSTAGKEIPQLLFDLIEPVHERFLICFYYAVRKTLVVDDLGDALHYAFEDDLHRKKVVTLDGEVVDPSGTMRGFAGRSDQDKQNATRGGGKEKREREREAKRNEFVLISDTNARVITNEEEQEYEEQKKTLGHKDEELKKIREELIIAETDVKMARQSTEQLIVEQKKCRLDHESIIQQLSNVEAELKRLTQSAAGFGSSRLSSEPAKSIQELQEQLEVKMAKMRELKQEVDEINKKVDELRAEIDSKGGNEMKQLKDEMETLQRLVDEKQKASNEFSHKLKTSKKGVSEANNQIAKGEAEMKKLDKQLNEIEEQKAKNLEEASAHYTKKEEIKTEMMGLPEKLEELEATHKEKKELMMKKRIEEVMISEKVEDLKKVVKENERRMAKLLEELGTLKNTTVGPDDQKVSLDFLESDSGKEQSTTARSSTAANTSEPTAPLSLHSASSSSADTSSTANDASASLTSSSPPSSPIKPPTLATSFTDMKEIDLAIHRITDALSRVQIDLTTIARYKQKEIELNEKIKELNEAISDREAEKQNCENLKEQRLTEFMTGFRLIAKKVKEMYQMLTLGGDAELELKDGSDPFTEGLVYNVRPPTKSWKANTFLSGGEKTLSSLALVFALHRFLPNPLFVMDEIDAALDSRNALIVANYIKTQTRNAQFIVVSLKNDMFELADRLIGIYKIDNCASSLAITPSLFVQPRVEQTMEIHQDVKPQLMLELGMGTGTEMDEEMEREENEKRKREANENVNEEIEEQPPEILMQDEVNFLT